MPPPPPNCWASTLLFGRAAAVRAAIVHQHGRPGRAEAARAVADRLVRVVDQALQADVVVRHEIRNRNHEVGHVVDLRIGFAVAELFAGDLEHFVLDDVAQVERLEDQVERALERDFLAQS